MKLAIIALSALALAGCEMTPTQKRWTLVATSVLVVGAIAAHDSENGKPPETTANLECTGVQCGSFRIP
jgi:hypothetical protein